MLLLIWNFSFAQQYTNYTVKDGLPSNHVYRITQDSKGFIWLITDTGISKFNGKKFKNFTTKEGLPTNDNWDITITPDDKVWYFSKLRALGYIENDSVHSFPSHDENDILFPASIAQYGNKVFFGYNDAWYFLDDNKWKPVDFSLTANEALETKAPAKIHLNEMNSKEIISIFKRNRRFMKLTNSSGLSNLKIRIKDTLSLWLHDDGYSIFNLKTEKLLYKKNHAETDFERSPIERFHFLNNEIQLTGNNFVRVLGEDFEIASSLKIPPEMDSHFSMIDRTGNVWIATFNNGIYMLPQIKRNISYCLISEKVSEIQTVGTKLIANVYNKGFYKYDSIQKNFEPFINAIGYVYNAVRIDSLNREFYISEQRIIEAIDNRTPYEIRQKDNAGNDKGRNLVYFKGFLYGNVSTIINKIDPKNFEVVERYQQVGFKKLISFNEQLILATSDGIKKLVTDSILPIHFSDGSLQKSILNIKAVDKGTLLVMTDGFGAYITNLKTNFLLPGSEYSSVQDAFIENSNIWIATEKGVLKYRKEKGNYVLERTFDESDGLPSNMCNSVAVTASDVLVSADNGIAIFSKSLQKEPQLLQIYFENAMYNSKPIQNNKSKFLYTANNNANFAISSIDYSEGESDLGYRYKLDPLQKEWITTTSETINFTDLPPNDYNLVIQSNEFEKSFEFSIQPLWWQRKEVRIIFAILGILILGLVLYLVRKGEIHKKTALITSQKKLAEYQLYALRSQMNPHFVFNSLTAIQYYINENDFENSEKYLVKFSQLIRQFFEISKQEEISLFDEIALLKNYLEIEKLRFKDKLNYSFFIDERLDTEATKLPTMLLQPVVENAVNHGIFNKEDNGNIKINFIYEEPHKMAIEIMDDGVGFANSRKRRNGKISSSVILKDRISILNQSQNWQISYATMAVFSKANDEGNKSTFTIKNLR